MTGGDRASVVITDPGKWPELFQAGLGFADQGRLRAYFTTLEPRRNRLVRAGRRLPGPAGGYVERETRRRDLGALSDHAVEAAAKLDLAVGVLNRVRGRSELSRRLIERRDGHFDRAVAAALPRDAAVVLGQAGACPRTLAAARARGARTVLNWNIQHWGFAEEQFAREREANPLWARHDVFTFTEFSGALRARWEAELEATDLVLTPSSAVTETFVERGFPAERLCTIPYGVALEKFPVPAREPHDRPLRVLSIGEISQRKGISYLFDVARRRPDMTFDCVGWRIAALPEEPPANVRLHFSAPSIQPFLAEADVFLFPSLIDGFGLVVLEAMACGLPVICTDHAGARDIVEDDANGWVVAARDVDRMVELLERLDGDRTRIATMAAAARATAERHPWSRFHAELAEALLP